MAFLEFACFNYDDAFTAIELGVDRIEIASQYHGGGITPDLKDLPNLIRNSSVPVHVLIRPRLGNFIYSLDELKVMYDQILESKDAGASAVVFGCLTPNGTIDKEANSFLLDAAKGIKSTFHRAFDGLVDYNDAMQQLIQLKFDALLTSGSPTTAFEGRNTLRQLSDQTENKIQLICGGGIRSNHIVELMRDTHAEWFHSACFDSQTLQLNKTELQLLKQFIHGQAS